MALAPIPHDQVQLPVIPANWNSQPNAVQAALNNIMTNQEYWPETMKVREALRRIAVHNVCACGQAACPQCNDDMRDVLADVLRWYLTVGNKAVEEVSIGPEFGQTSIMVGGIFLLLREHHRRPNVADDVLGRTARRALLNAVERLYSVMSHSQPSNWVWHSALVGFGVWGV